MVYPPEGLFYIEMDQAPPGKLGLKAAIVWFVGGRNVSKTAFAIFPACAIISSNACYKVDIVKCAAGADQTVVMEKSCALRSPSGIAQACIAQFTCQLRNTFRRTWRSGFASFLLSQQRTPSTRTHAHLRFASTRDQNDSQSVSDGGEKERKSEGLRLGRTA